MDLRLHHVGIVVGSIDEAQSYYEDQFGMSLLLGKTHDPAQDVYVAFLQSETAASYIELIEPASPKSPVTKALERGGGLNHLCYAVKDLDAAIKFFTGCRAIVIRRPVPAVAFANRRIAFLYTSARELIELVEDDDSSSHLLAL